jgi:hypothetical protein
MSLSLSFYLSEPVTEVAGGPDLYIDRGSTINLTCTVKYSPEPPHYIIWNHNNAVSFFYTRTVSTYEEYLEYLLELLGLA